MDFFDDVGRKENTDVGMEKITYFADVDNKGGAKVDDVKLDFDTGEGGLSDWFNADSGVRTEKDERSEVRSESLKDTSELNSKEGVSNSTDTQSGKINDRVFDNTDDYEASVNDPINKLDYVLDSVDNYMNQAIKVVGAGAMRGLVSAGAGAKRGASGLKRKIPCWLSDYQDNKLYSRFEKGRLVEAEDFEFLLYGGELMVYKYRGMSPHVVIPDYVGNLPVRYVYYGFLNRNLIDNLRVRNFFGFFKEDNVVNLSVDSLKDSLQGIKSLQLPKELVYLPKNLYSGMKLIKTVIVPASVKLISPTAFSKSCIKSVFFMGDAPKNLRLADFPGGLEIYCLKSFVNNFKEELSKRKE